MGRLLIRELFLNVNLASSLHHLMRSSGWTSDASGGGNRGGNMDDGRDGKGWGGNRGGRGGMQDGNPFASKADYYQHDYRS